MCLARLVHSTGPSDLVHLLVRVAGPVQPPPPNPEGSAEFTLPAPRVWDKGREGPGLGPWSWHEEQMSTVTRTGRWWFKLRPVSQMEV